MGNFDTARAHIKNVIKENNNQEITGNILQNVLIDILNNIGVGYIFGGIADPTTKPESLTGTNAPVYYISNKAGTYVNFDNIVVNENELAFLVNGSDKKWKKFSINIPIATTLKDGLLAKKDKAYIETLKPWLIAHDNVTTIDALNQELNAFGVKTAQGLHQMKCFGIPLFVTFANLNVGDSVLMQTIQGSITFNSAKTSIASINTTGNLTIAVRYYQGGKWGSWNTPMTPIEPPTVQTSSNGTTNNYIYSNGTDADKNCVASCNWWTYSHNGRIYVRWKRWGADDNTHYNHNNEAHQTSQYMLPYMGSDGGRCYQDGLLPWQWGQRMKDAGLVYPFMEEHNSTKDTINITYLNFANGERYICPISKATSAKAGVMTSQQYDIVNNFTNGVINKDNEGKFITSTGKNVIDTLSDVVGEEKSLDDFNNATESKPSNYSNKINLYKTKGAYNQDSSKYMLWFGFELHSTSGNRLYKYNFNEIAGFEPTLSSNNPSLYFLTNKGLYDVHVSEVDNNYVFNEIINAPYIYSVKERNNLVNFNNSVLDTISSVNVSVFDLKRTKADKTNADSTKDGLMSKESYKRIWSDLKQYDIATETRDGLMSKEDKQKLKFANVIYNLKNTEVRKIPVVAYPSISEEYVAGKTFNIYQTEGKDIPSSENEKKYGIWFGEYLGVSAGYKRYDTKSICGISSEELYSITPPNRSLKDYLFVDVNKNIVTLTKDSGGLSVEVNKTLEALLTVNDIIKLSK